MSDDLTKRKPKDSLKINVNQQYELDYWTKELGVTEEQLKEAVKKVGVMVKDVKKYLGIK